MDKKEWKETFKRKHLFELLEVDDDEDIYEEDDLPVPYEVVEEGENYISIGIGDDIADTYEFDEEMVNMMEKSIPKTWKVSDFIRMEYSGDYPIIEFSNKEKIITIKIEDEKNNGIKTNKKALYFEINSPEIDRKELRSIIEAVKNIIGKDIVVGRGSIIYLFDKEELKKMFGEQATNLYKTIAEIDFSMRGYICLSREGYKNAFDIVWEDKEEIKAIAQMGPRSYKEVLEKIEELGLEWNLKEKISL